MITNENIDDMAKAEHVRGAVMDLVVDFGPRTISLGHAHAMASSIAGLILAGERVDLGNLNDTTRGNGTTAQQ